MSGAYSSVRLPKFQLDTQRGRFDTWLYAIVQSKAVDIRRSRKRRASQAFEETLQTAADTRSGPDQVLEEKEVFFLSRNHLRERLSKCTFQVFQLRFLENHPVSLVATMLGITSEQVWNRSHRIKQMLEQLGLALEQDVSSSSILNNRVPEKKEKVQESAQGKSPGSVSPVNKQSSPPRPGVHLVDYVFQRVELGRRELTPEWNVEWSHEDVPRSKLYIRKTAIVAYAELCGTTEFIHTHWPQIVNAAIAAGVAAGIATIIATPTAALPIFQVEFLKQLNGKVGGGVDGRLQIALSAKQEANGPWCLCKE